MKKYITFKNTVFFLMLIFSILGLIAAFELTLDKIRLLKNPTYIPSCNINPILSCSNVINTKYSELFGFPNTIIGLVGYSVMVTVAMFVLFQGKVNKLFMILANLGGLFAFIFSYVLLWISVYKINSLCPFCLLSCFAATNLFFMLTLGNLKDNVFSLRPSINDKIQKFLSQHAYLPIIFIWHVIVLFWIILEFPNVLRF